MSKSNNISDFQLFCLDNSDRADLEASHRGYRGDIYVKIANNFYHINVYNITRLQQDFSCEIEQQNYYTVDPNIILVKEVSTEEIKFVVSKLLLKGYFSTIRNIIPDDNFLNQLIAIA